MVPEWDLNCHASRPDNNAGGTREDREESAALPQCRTAAAVFFALGAKKEELKAATDDGLIEG